MMNKAIFIASVIMAIAINQAICHANEKIKETRYVSNHQEKYAPLPPHHPQTRRYKTKMHSLPPPSESQAISAFGHIGFWNVIASQESFDSPTFSDLGHVSFTQENPSSELVIEFHLQTFKPSCQYIFQFHERTVADIFISAIVVANEETTTEQFNILLTDRCLAYAGNRFSGVGAGINYAPHGDIGELTPVIGGMITSTHRTSEFTLYGENSILGRSFVIFEQNQDGADPKKPIDLRLPPNSLTVTACGQVGISNDSPLPVSDGNLYSPSSYNFRSHSYSEEPRVGLAIIGGSMVGLSNQADAWGVVLFEQENSRAPLNVTGMFSFNSISSQTSLEISVHVGSIDEQFTTSDIETRCGSGGDVFQPEYGLLGGSELYFDLEGGDFYRGVEFSFLDTNYTLFGTESILGRSLQFHVGTTPELFFLINCASIGLYTPGNDLYDGLVKHYLRRPNDQRINRDSTYVIFREYVLNFFPEIVPFFSLDICATK